MIEIPKIKPFYPKWSQGKNKLIRFEDRPFDDGVGHTATITWAIYSDKNDETQEMVAYVKWKTQ